MTDPVKDVPKTPVTPLSPLKEEASKSILKRIYSKHQALFKRLENA